MHRVKVKETIASCFDLCNDGSLEVKQSDKKEPRLGTSVMDLESELSQ